MTDRADPGSPAAAESLARQASTEASTAATRLAGGLAARSGAAGIREPDVALRAARQLELAARSEVVAHIRRARESGKSWAAIGALLGFGPLAAGDGATVAEYAFDYTTGPRTASAWFNSPVFMWACPACGQMISDRGPGGCPADDEAGQIRGCPQLAATVAEWNASRW